MQIINEVETKKDAAKPHVVMLLDESGSMQPHRAAVISTANEFFNSVKDTAETVSLYTFDSKGIRMKINKVEPRNVITLTEANYQPDAMTPLYDAIGAVIMQHDATQKVQFVIHTDGAENNSKEWTFEGINEVIKSRTAGGWLFVFLGEGLQGREELKKFDGGLKVNYSANMRGQTMSAMSNVTRQFQESGSVVGSSYATDGTLDIDKGEKLRTGNE